MARATVSDTPTIRPDEIVWHAIETYNVGDSQKVEADKRSRQMIGTHKTRVTRDGSDITVRYWTTDIVQVSSDAIRLNTGGHFTPTTKRRMNEASEHFGLGFQVYQKDFQWYARRPNGDMLPFNGNSLDIERTDDSWIDPPKGHWAHKPKITEPKITEPKTSDEILAHIKDLDGYATEIDGRKIRLEGEAMEAYIQARFTKSEKAILKTDEFWVRV